MMELGGNFSFSEGDDSKRWKCLLIKLLTGHVNLDYRKEQKETFFRISDFWFQQISSGHFCGSRKFFLTNPAEYP